MKCATGEYIFFLDSDDWINTTAITKLVNLNLEYDCQLASCDFTNVIGPLKLKKQNKTPNILVNNIEKIKS